MKDLCLATGKVMPLVYRENVHQLEKWGVQDHEPFEWLGFATEELGETAKAIGEWEYRGGIAEDVVKEAIQTATLMLKIAEMFQGLLVTEVLDIPEVKKPGSLFGPDIDGTSSWVNRDGSAWVTPDKK